MNRPDPSGTIEKRRDDLPVGIGDVVPGRTNFQSSSRYLHPYRRDEIGNGVVFVTEQELIALPVGGVLSLLDSNGKEHRFRKIVPQEEELIPSFPVELSRTISPQDRYEIFKRQNWRCNSCGIKIKYSRDSKYEGRVGHIDHIHPYSKRFAYPGGEQRINDPDNLQGLCDICNLKKGRTQTV